MFNFILLITGNARCFLPVEYVNPQNISVQGGKITAIGVRKTTYKKRAAQLATSTKCNGGNMYCVPITCTITNLREEQSVIIKVSLIMCIHCCHHGAAVNRLS